MNRRLFVRLACSVIVGLSLRLPLGQTDFDFIDDSGAGAGDKILADVREMVRILSAEEKMEYGPYVAFLPDGYCQWVGYSEDTAINEGGQI